MSPWVMRVRKSSFLKIPRVTHPPEVEEREQLLSWLDSLTHPRNKAII